MSSINPFGKSGRGISVSCPFAQQKPADSTFNRDDWQCSQEIHMSCEMDNSDKEVKNAIDEFVRMGCGSDEAQEHKVYGLVYVRVDS